MTKCDGCVWQHRADTSNGPCVDCYGGEHYVWHEYSSPEATEYERLIDMVARYEKRHGPEWLIYKDAVRRRG